MRDKGYPMRITLLRHAPTRGNLLSRYVGSADEPLESEGIAVAEKAARNFAVKTAYTSSLLRSRQTAAILYPNAELVPLAGLNEMDFGKFEGKRWDELADDGEYARWLDSGCALPCPGGEGMDAFSRRCREAFMDAVGRHGGACAEAGDMHFVVHGGVIMAIMSGFVFPERDFFSWGAGFCGGFAIETTARAGRFALAETLAPPRTEEPA